MATCSFLDDATNVLSIGPSGVGKTMLAIALGHTAIDAGRRVYYTTAADLAARCRKATMRFFSGPSVLVIDELGYLPMPAQDASALFQAIARRCLKRSVILTTNREVASWGDISTGTDAILDRLFHRSVVFNIDGDSKRLPTQQARNHKRRPTGENN